LAAGRDVVGLGFGMLQADDTLGYVAPWWEHVTIQGSTNSKIPADQGALVAPVSHDRNGRIAELLQEGRLTSSAQADEHGLLHPQMIGLMSDHAMLRLAAGLACGVHPPDLILTEFAVTDTIQHYHGCDSEAAHWAM